MSPTCPAPMRARVVMAVLLIIVSALLLGNLSSSPAGYSLSAEWNSALLGAIPVGGGSTSREKKTGKQPEELPKTQPEKPPEKQPEMQTGKQPEETVNKEPPETPAVTGTSRLAKQVSADDLLARQPKAQPARIPRIFHQSWKTTELPNKFLKWSKTCRQKHQDWEWVVWTDEDNLKLVQKHFPWIEESYRGLPGEIYRADLVRAMYMYIYGGVYADLDTECLLPTEVLAEDYARRFLFDVVGPVPPTDTAIFGRMGSVADFEHSIPNAWMAAPPAHPFFLRFLQAVDEHVKNIRTQDQGWPSAEQVTGPVALRDAIAKYSEETVLHGRRVNDAVAKHMSEGPFLETLARDHDVLLLPSTRVYPYSWGDDAKDMRETCWVLSDGYDADKCKKVLGVGQHRSISITYWSHTHTPTGHDENNLNRIASE